MIPCVYIEYWNSSHAIEACLAWEKYTKAAINSYLGHFGLGVRICLADNVSEIISVLN